MAAIVLMTSTYANAQVVLGPVVTENFDSYNSTEDLLEKWPMVASAAHPDGQANAFNGATLIDSTNSTFPDIEGKAVQFDGSSTGGYYTINKYNTAFQMSPDADRNVKLSFDMYAPSTGTLNSNYKTTVGLRNSSGANLLEIGIHNSNPTPFIPFGFRLVSMGITAADATAAGLTAGGYGAFPLPAGKRNTSDAQVGGGWHRYEVVFSTTNVTLSIDLYGDGLNNAATSPEPGVGTAGVDATVTIPTAMNLTSGFNDLRFGVPSATGSSVTAAGFDNILLEYVSAATAPVDNADFNGDNIVDGNDFLAWQRNLGVGTTKAQGDANGNGVVDAADLAIWKGQFGTNPNVAAAVAAVPEPATASLAAVALLASFAMIRRK